MGKNLRTNAQIESDIQTQSKVCYQCKIRKPFTAFNKRAISPDGRLGLCRDCRHPTQQRQTHKRTDEEIQHDIQVQEKTCTTCNTRKSFSEFYPSDKSPDGVSYNCKDCKVTYNRLNNPPTRINIPLEDRPTWEALQQRPCTHCGIAKPWSEFSPKSNGLFGIATICKPCRAEQTRQNKKSV